MLTQVDLPRIIEAVSTYLSMQPQQLPTTTLEDNIPDNQYWYLLGLRYVDLILENIEDTCTCPTLPSQLENISTGTAFPPVPTFPCEKNESGAFIEMGDLIPTHLGLDNTARSKLRHSVTNISKWLPAFAVYVSVIAKTQPHHVPDLMGYQILILEASNEYRNDCWLEYD